MRTSCLEHPAGEHYVSVRPWLVSACDGDHCAAALLNFFEYWHNIKLEHQGQAAKHNQVAEFHGDRGTQDTTLWQFHTERDLEEGVVNLYSYKTIRKSLQLIINKGYISTQSNPNPRYHFDRTRYILFHPEPLRAFLRDYTHPEKMPDASGKNAPRSGKSSSPSGKNAPPIPEITPEITPEIEDPLTPAELGSACCAQGDEAEPSPGTPRELGTNPRALETNPRALGTNLRALDMSPRQVEAQQDAVAKQQARETLAACPSCQGSGFLDCYEADQTFRLLRCPHDLGEIQRLLAAKHLTWPAAPPGATDHGPAP